ncbi:MAG: hypothetical protein HAW63_00760 [Bdellovibrionaceae bacterium]|nr:hypothetical protein [Pseudobdellovibrionaceae bacterium]
MKYLGLDITSTEIRAILIQKNALQYSIIEKKSFPLIPNTDDALLKTLLQVQSYFAYNDIQTCVGVEASKCFVRTLQLPFSQKFKLNKILPFQLEEELPVEPNNLATDMLFLNKSKEKDSEILVVATKKKELQLLIKNLNALNFNLESIAPIQLSLTSILPSFEEDSFAKKTKVYLNLDLRSSYLNIAKIYNGQCYITQSTPLNYSLSTLIKQLADKYSISLEQAETEFLKNSFIVMPTHLNGITPEQKEFSDNITSHLQEFITEIKKEFLKLKLTGEDLASIEIYGEALCIKNLKPFLKQEINITITDFQTQVLQSPEELSAKHDIKNAKFINALSLAVSMSTPLKQINFLQGELSPSNQKIKKFWTSNQSVIKIGLATWTIAIIFGFFKQSITYKMADDSYFNLKKIAKKTTKLKGRKLKLSSIKKIVKTYKKQKNSQDFFSQLQKVKTPIYFFNKLSTMPRTINVNITYLDISTVKKQMTVKGYSKDSVSSINFKSYLQSISKNKKPIGRAVKTGSGTTFNYTIPL